MRNMMKIVNPVVIPTTPERNLNTNISKTRPEKKIPELKNLILNGKYFLFSYSN
jgi:hypothetical protein